VKGQTAVDNPLVQLDPGLYLWTIFTFLVLVLLLRKFAWQPLLKAMDERQKTIARAVDDARLAREQLQQTQQETVKILNQARVDADSLLTRARSDAEQLRQEQRQKALAEAGNITKNAEQQIQRETAKAIEQIRKETVDLSVAIASKLIQRNITKEDNERLIEDALKQLQ
jgi:F-type H+-transporting ATPase subunit b